MDMLGWILALGGTVVGGIILLFLEYGYFQKKKLRDEAQIKKIDEGNNIKHVVDQPRHSIAVSAGHSPSPALAPQIKLSPETLTLSVQSYSDDSLVIEVLNNTPHTWRACRLDLLRLERWSSRQQRLVTDSQQIPRLTLIGPNVIEPDRPAKYTLSHRVAMCRAYIVGYNQSGQEVEWRLDGEELFCAFLELRVDKQIHTQEIFFSVGSWGTVEVCPDPRERTK